MSIKVGGTKNTRGGGGGGGGGGGVCFYFVESQDLSNPYFWDDMSCSYF